METQLQMVATRAEFTELALLLLRHLKKIEGVNLH